MQILLIEDDEELAADLLAQFVSDGYAADHVSDGTSGLAHLSTGNYDVAIVDRMLPGMTGLSIVEAARAHGVRTPVLLLTTLDGLHDRIAGLDAGGDDYLAKPFAMAELSARVRALARRRQSDPPPIKMRVHDLEIDRLHRTVSRAGRAIILQQREFALLEFLVARTGDVVTRIMLLQGVWGLGFDPGTNVVESHLSRLRAKIDRGMPPLIHTERGVGYVIRAPE